MVRHGVKPDQVATDVELVRAVYDELHRDPSAGFRYATFRLPDGVSFVHLAEAEDGHDPLSTVQACRHFREGIADRCDEEPVVTELCEIGSYRPLADTAGDSTEGLG
jgi:hypothetical protein